MKANLAKGFHRLETMLTNRNDKIERLQSINAVLLAALEAMSEHFEIIGVGRKGSSIYQQAQAAIAKAGKE